MIAKVCKSEFAIFPTTNQQNAEKSAMSSKRWVQINSSIVNVGIQVTQKYLVTASNES